MKIDKIITMANQAVELDFLAMYRSLRATGCELPVYVIPFDETKFDLPDGALWYENETLFRKLEEIGSVKHCRKLVAFTFENFAYFDTDIIHVRSFDRYLASLPAETLIVADPEWSIAKWTFSDESREIFKRASTSWLLDNFNSGFFAHGGKAITEEKFNECLDDPLMIKLCRGGGPTRGEQAAANYLVFNVSLPVVNLALPPFRMESTFCWDYPEDYEVLLNDSRNPTFFIHLVSKAVLCRHPMSALFFKYLSKDEGAIWWSRNDVKKVEAKWPILVRMLNRLVALVDPGFHVQPRKIK